MTANAYILSVLGLFRRNARFFVLAGLAGVGLRLLFVFRFPAIIDDSRLYADIAVNWLQHGLYGITNSGRIMPTLSRLPGYPVFLAATFAVFGIDNFRAVLVIQVLLDMGTCFLIADLARRMLTERAAKAAFLLAALCPFLANYSAAAMTETLEIFFTALALDLAVRGIAALCGIDGNQSDTGLHSYGMWLACGLAVSGCILLRPDGGIVLIAIAGYLLFFLSRLLLHIIRSGGDAEKCYPRSSSPLCRVLLTGILVAFGALAPLIPWTLRNLHMFHRFEPLAPRYANDADETPMPGFNRWTKTWIADYASVEEIYWNVPGDAIDAAKLPRRAFDSHEQRQKTVKLFDEYNQEHEITPELDSQFAELAAQRIDPSPLRYYLWLPALRIADMWLRPRTELLPSDPRWWEFNDAAPWLAASIVFGVVNLFFAGAAVAGFLRSRHVPGMGLLLLFVAFRSLFLGTLENPEPRYTLECYPVVIVAAAALFIHKSNGKHRKPA